MSYNTDRPIKSFIEDSLGRSSFSKQLGKAISEYKGKDSLVNGLYGKWGTGKTSVANMALEELEKESSKNVNKPIILKFNPWNYSDKDNLINLFFSELQSKIKLSGNKEYKKSIGKFLKEYASWIDVTSLSSFVGCAFAPLVKALILMTSHRLLRSNSLSETKMKLAEALAKSNQKIVVVIDDIDRLTNSQIRDIFQLVKQVGDFPNIIYILIMERQIVQNALSEIHNCDGNEYLEKIIQIPFEIPELNKIKVKESFYKKLDYTLEEISPDIIYDQQYFSKIFSNCIEPYLQNLRDINRLFNVFFFRYSLLFKETSLEDMIGITAIEVFEPKLFKWIASNKDAICGGRMHAIITYKKSAEELKNIYKKSFKELGIDPEKALNCVAAMFPMFAKDIGMHLLYSYESFSDMKSQMRIGHYDRFDLYFAMDIEKIPVSRTIINECIYNLDKLALKEIILEINKKGNIAYFLEQLMTLVDKVPYERLNLIATVLINEGNEFLGFTNNIAFPISASNYVIYCIDDIIKRLKTSEERYEVLNNNLQVCSAASLGIITKIIIQIETAYGKVDRKKFNKEDQLISIEQLVKLEKLYVKKVKEIVYKESISNIKELAKVKYLWESIDLDSATEFFKSFLIDNVSKLKFVCKMAENWYGTSGNGWSYTSKYYSNFISNEEIYEMIDKFDKNNLDVFTELEQIKLASFFLNYKKDEMYNITEERAKELVAEWKNSCTPSTEEVD